MNINQSSTTATAPTTAADYLITKDDGFPKEEGGRIYADAYDLIGTETTTAPTTAATQASERTQGIAIVETRNGKRYHAEVNGPMARIPRGSRNFSWEGAKVIRWLD